MIALPNSVRGFGLSFRRVGPDDAAFVYRLRSDPNLAQHLSPVTGGVAGQRAWIERTQAHADQAYYVIQSDRPCGLVRLYDVTPQHFTWGSWVLDPATRPRRAALASAMLVYRVGFDAGCEAAVFDVRRANWRTLAFHDRFGAPRVGATEADILYRLPRVDWPALAASHAPALEGAPA